LAFVEPVELSRISLQAASVFTEKSRNCTAADATPTAATASMMWFWARRKSLVQGCDGVTACLQTSVYLVLVGVEQLFELLNLPGDLCRGNEHHLVAGHRAAVLLLSLLSLLIVHALCPAGCAQLRGPAQAPLNWPSCNIIEAIIRLCYEIA